MLDIDHERRQGERVALDRPCKVYDPRSRKYIAGHTCNVTPGGMLLRLDRRVPIDAGDSLYVGIAQTRRHALLRTDEMVEARVVRALGLTGGETAVAVRFVDRPREEAMPIRVAA